MVADWEHLYGQFPEYQLKRYGLKGALEIIIITKLVDAYMRLIAYVPNVIASAAFIFVVVI